MTGFVGYKLQDASRFKGDKMNQTEIKTSESHPLRIDWVSAEDSWGRVGMSFCPGKVQQHALSGTWQRDIHLDVRRIREEGGTMVISLIELHEFAELEVAMLPAVVQAAGLDWVHLPIADQCAPNADWMQLWARVGRSVVERLSRGDAVFVHCKGGLGRTGTVAACLLIEAGMAPVDAIRAVRASRRGTIETRAQEDFVTRYMPLWRSHNDVR